jgi:cell division protein FtsL
MEEYPERHDMDTADASSGWVVRRWLLICLVLAATACVALGYGYRQHAQANQMASQADDLHATVNQLQGQINALNSKLNEMAVAQQAAATQLSSAPVPAAAPTAKRVATIKRRAPQNSSLRQLQARLEAQQKQLAAVQDEMARTRSDLQGNIDSTRDELNGSIAKTHDELLALEKRGERSYFEFDLTKSKEFQRFGPLMLSLRKADTKHKSYDLNLILDDNRLTKKHVDLYEPIWLHLENRVSGFPAGNPESNDVQPVQVVVNQIDKNHIHGYVSAPKHAEAHQANAASAPAAAPSATPSQSNPAPPPQQ